MARITGNSPSYSVTSAGINPAEDRAHRIRMYFIAMSLRVVCVVSLFWVRGWWLIIPVLGAILFPWFAVMVGNAVAHGGEQKLDAPDPLKIEGGSQGTPDGSAPESESLLIFDVDPVRRSEDLGSAAAPEKHAAPGEESS